MKNNYICSICGTHFYQLEAGKMYKCKKCGHEFQAQVSNRAMSGGEGAFKIFMIIFWIGVALYGLSNINF